MALLQYNLLYHLVYEMPILCIEGVVNWGGRVEASNITVRGTRRDKKRERKEGGIKKEREKKEGREGGVSLGRRREWYTVERR